MKDERRYKMTGWTARILSDKQIGIQFGHAVVRYIKRNFAMPQCTEWIEFDETFVILNGGSTNNNPDRLGELNLIVETLKQNRIIHETFTEVNVGDQLTAVVILVDDRVWNRKKWPDFTPTVLPEQEFLYKMEFEGWKNKFSDYKDKIDEILFLRSFLPKFRSA